MRNRKVRYLLVTSLLFYLVAVANDKLAMYMLCWISLSLLVIAWVTARLGVRGLTAHRQVLLPRVEAGDNLLLHLRLGHRSSLPKANLLIEDSLTNQTLGGTTARTSLVRWLPAGGEVVVEVGVPAVRGRHAVGPATVVTADPLGLFEHRRLVPDSHGEVLVRPRTVALPAFRPPGLGGGVGRQSLRSSSGFDFRGLRDYQSGDDLRLVHWKSTAHTGRLQVREFDVLEAAEATVLLDLWSGQVFGDGRESSLEAAIVAAGSIVIRLHELGLRVRFLAHEAGWIDIPVRPDVPAPDELWDSLATVRGVGEMPAGAVLAAEAVVGRGDLVIVVTASDDPGLVSGLAELQARGGQPVLVRLDGPAFAAARAGETLPAPPPLPAGLTAHLLRPGDDLATALDRREVAR